MHDAKAVLTPAATRSSRPRATGPEGKRSLEQVSRRFAEVFYRMALESMMDTIPGRENASAVGSAGWQFMSRHLPGQLVRGGGRGMVRYVRNSVQSASGGQLNERM